MSRRSMRLMAKETEKENIASKVFESKSEKEAGFEPEFENEENVEPNFDVFEPKTEEELEEEIRLELKQRMQKYDDLPTKEIQTTPSKKIKVSEAGSIGKWLTEKEKRRKFLLTSSVPKSLGSKLPKPSGANFDRPKPSAAKKLKLPLQEIKESPARVSSRSIRKRSPQRQKVIPPKSPFKFVPNRRTPKKIKFSTTEEPFVFGKTQPEVKPVVDTIPAATPRKSRKTVFKNVVGNYNSKTCKHVAMSARERRMAYSRGVDQRNLRPKKASEKHQPTQVKRGVKERTKRARPERNDRRADRRKTEYMKNRKID